MGLLDLLDRPIAFHRPFMRLTGCANAALMLSQGVYWHLRTSDPAGWFYKSQEEWEAEIGLTRSKQETARRRLRELGVWEERLSGLPAKLYFRVLPEPLEGLLLALETPRTRMQESRRQVCRNPADLSAESQQSTRTKITSKTTSFAEGSAPAGEGPRTVAEQRAVALPTQAGQSADPFGGSLSAAEQPQGAAKQAARGTKAKVGPQPLTNDAWNAYATAYEARYRVSPVRNGKVNGMLAQVVGRVGVEAAPNVAGFYLRLEERDYLRSFHSISLLLRDCEKLHTQMQLGASARTQGDMSYDPRNDDRRRTLDGLTGAYGRGGGFDGATFEGSARVVD